ncbi:MAG TPA: cyclic nucleotide-binding domain-containing protein [Acidobacteriota bacterium]|nr:cyclic nucleotide-binding domain-containing protein [Acidobacteriota bacterium]
MPSDRSLLTTIEKIFILQEIDFLAETSTDHLALLADLFQEETRKPGQYLVRSGVPCSSFYLLVDGRVALEKPNGEIEQIERGPVNFWVCLSRRPSRLAAKCLEECRLLVMPSEDLLDALTTEPGLSLAILKHHARTHWT